MRTLFLVTQLLGVSAKSSSCNYGDQARCTYGTSLLQVSANPETGALLDVDLAQDPANATTAAPTGDSAPANATTPEATTGAPEVANVTAATNATNATNTANATNDTNASNATPSTVTGCSVKEDPRAKAWFAETSPEGTPCVFGVDGDVRDEGAHCIFDNGDFGSNGWCYTAKDRSSWGSCNDLCPLYGPTKQLGKKIDHMDKMVDKVIKSLNSSADTNSNTEEKVAEEVVVTTAAPKADTGTKGPTDAKESVADSTKKE